MNFLTFLFDRSHAKQKYYTTFAASKQKFNLIHNLK